MEAKIYGSQHAGAWGTHGCSGALEPVGVSKGKDVVLHYYGDGGDEK